MRVPATVSLIAYANDFSEFGPKAGCDQVPLSVVNWTYPNADAGANSASFAQSFKAGCTGGRAALTTINGGTPVDGASPG